MVYTSAARSLTRVVMLFITLPAISPSPLQPSLKATDLLEYLKASMENTERRLSAKQDLPVLRRRIKSPILEDYNGSADDYIGKDEPSRNSNWGGNAQLKSDEAYRSFLVNHLRVTDERSVPPDFIIKNPGSIEYKIKLFCRNGFLVEILPNGTVRGTQDHDSPYTRLTILMYGRQLVIIRTQKQPYRYLVMTSDSKVKAVPKRTIQSVFFYRVGNKKDKDKQGYLSLQRAYKRRNNWFLALKKRDNERYGTMKKGRNTNPNKRSAQFIVLKY